MPDSFIKGTGKHGLQISAELSIDVAVSKRI